MKKYKVTMLVSIEVTRIITTKTEAGAIRRFKEVIPLIDLNKKKKRLEVLEVIPN